LLISSSVVVAFTYYLSPTSAYSHTEPSIQTLYTRVLLAVTAENNNNNKYSSSRSNLKLLKHQATLQITR
jgi:hypothetical protein